MKKRFIVLGVLLALSGAGCSLLNGIERSKLMGVWWTSVRTDYSNGQVVNTSNYTKGTDGITFEETNALFYSGGSFSQQGKYDLKDVGIIRFWTDNVFVKYYYTFDAENLVITLTNPYVSSYTAVQTTVMVKE